MSQDKYVIIRKAIEKIQFYWIQFLRYCPMFYYQENLRTINCKFYDCSVTHKMITKTHFIDIWLNNHPPYGKKWLALAGFTIWIPFTWEGIKKSFLEYFADPELELYSEMNEKIEKIDKELVILRDSIKQLIEHGYNASETLNKAGYSRKAKLLEDHIEKVANHSMINIDTERKDK